MKKTIIYMHKNKINGKSYIGQTRRSIQARSGSNGTGYADSPKFYNAIKKYGWDNFEHIILCECELEEADDKEKFYIQLYDTVKKGYNSEGGGNVKKEVSKETRQKQRVAHLGVIPWNKGKKLGAPWNKGIPASEEAKNNLRQKLTGRHHTIEARQKISQSQYKPVICVETGEKFPSFKAAAQSVNISPPSISYAIRGKTKTAGGFHWKLASKENVK